ncbi:Hydroxymethylglutaryl-CoA synthase [Nosema granulosis]|uniref:Hydroxymethylglutaryl-CoA synthase n=1 Tax=Nosema granulosis TaxID=83296 RepID=A0A9P6H1R2_9MICR|nr:Hydroxymethylglutaryl-CoA synthase [Nosema granulosis]
MSSSRIGIVAMEYQFPKYVIKQEEVANGLKIDINKLKIGLGLEEFSVPDQNEDCVSLALSAISNLLEKNSIDLNDVGKIEVGSESNFDGAKSIKSYLMDVFSGNNSISGCDNINACYGGTNALLNSLAWLDSCLCTKKYAIVVCTDISLYQDKSCIPTSGGGAVAMLLGKDPVLAIIPKDMRHYSSNECDFLKPVKSYPFPAIKGKESIDVYFKAFEHLYSQSLVEHDYIAFHAPYPKLVRKLCQKHNIEPSKYEASLLTSRRNGNSYTASLYFSLISLLSKVDVAVNERILMFSFGSGCVATLFCLEKVREGCDFKDFEERLNKRRPIQFSSYLKIVNNWRNPSVDSLDGVKEDGKRFSIQEIVGDSRRYGK